METRKKRRKRLAADDDAARAATPESNGVMYPSRTPPPLRAVMMTMISAVIFSDCYIITSVYVWGGYRRPRPLKMAIDARVGESNGI